MVANCGTWILTIPAIMPESPGFSLWHLFVAVIMQICSLLDYAPYLLQTPIVDLSYEAFAILVIIVIPTADLIPTLYSLGEVQL